MEGKNTMNSSKYQKLNPFALAIAGAAAATSTFLFFSLPMSGFGGMMGADHGGFRSGGWMMGGYGNAPAFGFGMMWFFGAILAALAGAVVAWVYNAVNAASNNAIVGRESEGGSNLPTSPSR